MRDAAIAIAVLAVLMIGGQLLFRRRRQSAAPRHVPSTGGTFVLTPPRRNAVLLGITFLIPTAVLGLVTYRGFRVPGTGAGGLVAGVLASVLVLGVAVYHFASAVRSRVVVHDTGIERVGVFRQRMVGWKSVAKIAFNPVQHWFFVTASDGSHLWLPADIPGMGDFAAIALRRLPPPVLQAADPVVREVLEELSDAAREETKTRSQ